MINQVIISTMYIYIYRLSKWKPHMINGRKFRSETSDNRDSWKSKGEKSQRGEEKKWEDQRSKEDAGARKGRKVAIHCVFPTICGSGGSKSRLAKAAGAEPAGQMRDEKLHAVVARSTFPSQNAQNPQSQTTFGSWDVDQVHAVVARSTCPSQKCKKVMASDHFWKMRCWKSVRRFGAKHIWQVKMRKHTILGPLLEVAMSKKCTPLWREAHFQVKMLKAARAWITFWLSDVEKVQAVVAWSRFPSQHVQNATCTDHFWPLRCGFCVAGARDCAPCQKWVKTWGFCSSFNYNYNCNTLQYPTLQESTLHYSKVHYTTPHYTKLHYLTLHYTTLHYITLHYTSLHYTTVYFTTLHYATLHYATLHYTTVHYTTVCYTTQHPTTLHYITLHYTTLHYTTLYYTTQHSTTLHYTTLHYITLHFTPLHYITLHYSTLHYTTVHRTPLHSTTLNDNTVRYTPLHYHYTTLHFTTPHYSILHYKTLHYITLPSTALHYTATTTTTTTTTLLYTTLH